MTIIKIVGRSNYIPDKKALLISFLITLSGCASVSNSERFYQNHPRGRINWRESMTG